VLSGLKKFPIEIDAFEEPDWEAYETFMSQLTF
jgi:hypothetical protein